MPEEIQRKMKRLEKLLGTKTVDQSWYYCFLKEKYNQLTNKDKNLKISSIMKLEERTAEEIEQIKYSVLRESLNIIKPQMANEWWALVNTKANNIYYINVIEAAICLVKEINNGKSLDEAEKLVLKDNFDLSGFQLKILQDIISTYFNDNIYISSLRNTCNIVYIDGFSK